MYRNTVCSDDNIVYLDEYKKSSLHQKRQQNLTYKNKKHEKKKKSPKLVNNKEPHSKSLSFIVAIALVGVICFAISYCINVGSAYLKTETVLNTIMTKH